MHFPRLIVYTVYKQTSTVTPKRGGTTNCYVSWPQNWAPKFKLFAITAAVVQPTPLLIRYPEWQLNNFDAAPGSILLLLGAILAGPESLRFRFLNKALILDSF